MTAPEPSSSTSTPDGKGGGMTSILTWFFRPTDQINYNFISGMYGGGTLLSVVLYVLERALSGYYKGQQQQQPSSDGGGGDEDESSMSEFTRQLEGLYLVFVPFFPCLLWSLVVRARWLDEQKRKKDV